MCKIVGTRAGMCCAAVVGVLVVPFFILAEPGDSNDQAPPFPVNPLTRARMAVGANQLHPNPLSPRSQALSDRLTQHYRTIRANQLKREASGKAAAAAGLKRLVARSGESFAISYRPKAGTPSMIRGNRLHDAVAGLEPGPERDKATARDFLRTNKVLLGLDDPDSELAITRNFHDQLRFSHVRMIQSYKGIPVWPAELIVHLDRDGNVSSMEGGFIRTPRHMALEPTLIAATASELAREAVGVGGAVETSKPGLVIHSLSGSGACLAWKMEVYVGAAARWLVVVDAHTGAIVTKYNQINDSPAPGSGFDLGGATRNLSVWEVGGSFFMVDTSKQMRNEAFDPMQDIRSGSIYVFDAGNTPPDPQTQPVSDVFDITSNSAMTWPIRDAVSAAYNLSETYDYYLERHSRDALDGQGGSMVAVVRVGVNYENAFWDGQRIYFGDGSAFAGAIDIVGHELTHGVVTHTADLVYKDESGALNEAFADIFGEMVEKRSTGTADWVTGASLGTPARSFITPELYNQPSRMSDFFYTTEDNGGVHINSGIINHAYYLLAEGSASAIGTTDAERIFYRALSVHLFKSARFVDARQACITSAEELFGAGSTQATAVAEAFDAVEIFGTAPPTTPDPSFPEVEGPDATLFVNYDADIGAHFLARREAGLGDSEFGVFLSSFSIGNKKPAVTGDGSLAVFVDSIDDVCLIDTIGGSEELCTGFDGTIHGVAMAPQGDQFAIIFLDENGGPDNTISILDMNDANNSRDIILRAPLADGGVSVQVDFADAMTFSANGDILFYDAFNEIRVSEGLTLGSWSVYALVLSTDTIVSVVPPMLGFDFAFPSLTHTGDNFMLFDARDTETNDSTIFAMDLFTGDLTDVGFVNGGYGVPGFTGDDSAVVYSTSSSTPTGFSLVHQPVVPETMAPTGTLTTWLENADFGVVYRRGIFNGPEPGPPNPPADSCPDDPDKTKPGACGCGIVDFDSDGDFVADCVDLCPDDPQKSAPGSCGCGQLDTDSDGDAVADCVDNCPSATNATQADSNGNGVGDACDSAAAPSPCGAGAAMIMFVLPILGIARSRPSRWRRGKVSS